ncbi:MAG: glutathione binding-like protein, partial [Casimicrobiaceae bacterium]
YGVLVRHLRGRDFIAGEYSIADVACYPWVLPERQRQHLDDFPDLKRWKRAIAARPATERAYAIAKRVNVKPAISDEESRRILFGQDRMTVR